MVTTHDTISRGYVALICMYPVYVTWIRLMMYSTSLMTTKAVSTETRNTREVARMKKNILKTKLFRMGAISTLKNPLCSRVILSKEKEEVDASSSVKVPSTVLTSSLSLILSDNEPVQFSALKISMF